MSAAPQVNILPLLKAQRPSWLEVQPLLDEDFGPWKSPNRQNRKSHPQGTGRAEPRALPTGVWGTRASGPLPDLAAKCPAPQMVSARGLSTHTGKPGSRQAWLVARFGQQARAESPLLRTLRLGVRGTGSRWPSEVARGRRKTQTGVRGGGHGKVRPVLTPRLERKGQTGLPSHMALPRSRAQRGRAQLTGGRAQPGNRTRAPGAHIRPWHTHLHGPLGPCAPLLEGPISGH